MDSLLLIYDGEQFLELFAGWSLAAVLLPNCKLGQVRQRYESLDLAGGLQAETLCWRFVDKIYL